MFKPETVETFGGGDRKCTLNVQCSEKSQIKTSRVELNMIFVSILVMILFMTLVYFQILNFIYFYNQKFNNFENYVALAVVSYRSSDNHVQKAELIHKLHKNLEKEHMSADGTSLNFLISYPVFQLFKYITSYAYFCRNQKHGRKNYLITRSSSMNGFRNLFHEIKKVLRIF